jgi:hypothetical protein
MKLYIDDERSTPTGWDRAYTTSEAIDMLKTRKYTAVSFDHDLGNDEDGDGHDVATWLEEECYTDPTFPVPLMVVHSGNPVGRARIEKAIASIERRDASRNTN